MLSALSDVTALAHRILDWIHRERYGVYKDGIKDQTRVYLLGWSSWTTTASIIRNQCLGHERQHFQSAFYNIPFYFCELRCGVSKGSRRGFLKIYITYIALTISMKCGVWRHRSHHYSCRIGFFAFIMLHLKRKDFPFTEPSVLTLIQIRNVHQIRFTWVQLPYSIFQTPYDYGSFRPFATKYIKILATHPTSQSLLDCYS